MSQLRRGSASVTWVIVLAVVCLFAIAFGFMQSQSKSEVEARVKDLETSLAAEQPKTQEQLDLRVEISKAVGFNGGQDATPSSLDAISKAVESATNTAPSAKGAKTLESAINGLTTDYNAAVAQNRDLSQQLDQLRNDLAARQREFATALGEKDTTVAGLRTELEDTRNSSNTQVVDLERQRDALREQVRDGETQLSTLRTQMQESGHTKDTENQRLQQTNNILSEKLNTVQKQSSQPDGSVLSVSGELGRVWLDRGRLDRIRVGMQFEVRNRTTGHGKGTIRVAALEDRRAQAEIVAQTDRFDPITVDDPVYNELYDPGRTPVAVLLGNGFGKMSNDQMKNMLTQVGIRVEPNVTVESDYLILGTPFFDPDTGELIPWENQDLYKSALSYSATVVPYRDALGWLGL